MVSEPTESVGSAFIRELLTELPPGAMDAAKRVLRRFSGQVLHVPKDDEKAERITYTQTLIDAKLTTGEIIERITVKFEIGNRQAERVVHDARRLHP
jgi:hypothetical protein